jgi:hypothetical protein
MMPAAGVVSAPFFADSSFFANASRSRRARSITRCDPASVFAFSFLSRFALVTSEAYNERQTAAPGAGPVLVVVVVACDPGPFAEIVPRLE